MKNALDIKIYRLVYCRKEKQLESEGFSRA